MSGKDWQSLQSPEKRWGGGCSSATKKNLPGSPARQIFMLNIPLISRDAASIVRCALRGCLDGSRGEVRMWQSGISNPHRDEQLKSGLPLWGDSNWKQEGVRQAGP